VRPPGTTGDSPAYTTPASHIQLHPTKGRKTLPTDFDAPPQTMLPAAVLVLPGAVYRVNRDTWVAVAVSFDDRQEMAEILAAFWEAR
jgi:hypothetical protein